MPVRPVSGRENSDHERVSVEIPAGIPFWPVNFYYRQGRGWCQGDTSGDLIVTIEVSQHKDFERRETILHFKLRYGILLKRCLALPLPLTVLSKINY